MSPKFRAVYELWQQYVLHARLVLADFSSRARVLFKSVSGNHTPSLVNRLFVFLLMGTIVVYLIGVAGLYLTTDRLIEDSLRKQAGQWIAEMDDLGTPLFISRKKDLSIIEKRIKTLSEISFVRYYDSSGTRLLGQFGQYQDEPLSPLTDEQKIKLSAIANLEEPFLLDSTASDGRYFRIISAIRVRSIRSDGLFNFNYADSEEEMKIIGYIDLAINPNSYRAQLRNSLVFGSLITAIIFFVALFAGRRLIRRALHPLTDLQTPLTRLAKGELDVSVVTSGDREIVAIGDALNVTISAIKERNETLRRLAERDMLTGLFNRNYLSNLLDTELAWVKRGKMSSALLFIDLDRFKYVNDVLGHGAGDRLLVEVAGLINTRMRGHDVVARFGGDEFTVVAREVSKEQAIRIAKSILDIFRDYHFVERGESFSISCTIGVAMITPESRDAEEVLSQADSACYEAKASGRNRYSLYELDRQQQLTMVSDIGWSRLIKNAIKGEGFTLVYQPIESIAKTDREIYEVLLRMHDKDGNVLMPGLFLPVAERFGLLAEVDRWVITHALKKLAEFRSQGRDIVFSINLSGQTMADPAAIDLIKDNLARNALPPGALIFEITEQIAVRYLDKARHLIQKLIDLGCRFALDDFGVGFSSFNYLKRLSVSQIKLDGSFIEHLASDPIDQVLVMSIVQIARALDKEVVAEFVQDDATIELLKGYGVDFVQGYHVGKPQEELSPPEMLQPAAAAADRGGRARRSGTARRQTPSH